ncbi:ribosome biogenesis GTP-binding protein YihA/YsxC [Syntrophomonas erecta]
MLKIKQAEFIGVYVDLKLLPGDNKPEIAVVGRSNVGKSSFINRLANQRNLAKSSSTPGKTRTINYYQINQEWYMVDLPGYGFAKVSRAEQRRWGQLIENYLSQRKQLKGVILLVDIRHSPSQGDMMMMDWLIHYQIPVLIVANKADKISRGARPKYLTVIRKAFNLAASESPIAFSAVKGDGMDEILEQLQEILSL